MEKVFVNHFQSSIQIDKEALQKGPFELLKTRVPNGIVHRVSVDLDLDLTAIAVRRI